MVGDILLSSCNDGNFLSKAIKFFTNSEYTHTAPSMGDLGLGTESFLSAEPMICVLPKTNWDKPTYKYKIFHFKNVPEDFMRQIVLQLYKEYAGTVYGWRSLFWFIYRWLMEKFGRDVRKQKNWFTVNGFCSELTYRLMLPVAEQYYPSLYLTLLEWNAETFSPKDTEIVISLFPNYFEEIK